MAEKSSLRRDITSAYLASGARILSWVVVSAVVFRYGGVAEFGILALIRGTIGLLNYVSLGLGPAMVKLFSQAREAQEIVDVRPGEVLSYARPPEDNSIERLYSNAMTFAVISALVGLILVLGYAIAFRRIHWVPGSLARSAVYITMIMGMGLLLRLISDAPGAVLQTTGRIARDNRLLLESEVIWVALTVLLVVTNANGLQLRVIMNAAIAYAAASFVLMLRRSTDAGRIAGRPQFRLDRSVMGKIFAIGGMVTLAQLADFLYAPTDYILINHFLGPRQVAWYAPAVQVDSALLVLVSGMAAVLYPWSAVAHGAGDVAAVRKYYLRGTLASAGILLGASLLVWLIAPFLFRIWLGSDMPITREILPLVLIHTVIGGSAMVGRSVLLAIGKTSPFAISVLIAGVTNVGLSYIFVKHMGWGLKGIVMGTIVAVSLRCLVWMPWYVMRSLREVKEAPVVAVEAPVI
jgi:O-antigen/teichoic acid export membrane protein